ncbi:MAG: hypothetical protein KAW49_07060 [Anaerolineae bacterium]|nr:hypothetical protein [Anaerolineae bacterium]MCK4471532.1 hypothetical protein [Anaerolineae bacterium]
MYKDRGLILTIIGGFLLLAGIAVAFLGPAEMYCFYLFSEGGRFHYKGFGFGSFMFGNIACQIIGYYLIAALCIPLGYGHLKVRRWARTLSLTLLGLWLVVGAPLTVVFFLILVTAKDLSLLAVLIAVIFLALSYLVIPALLIRFYQSRNVRLTFEARDPRSYSIEKLPLPILVLCSLFLFYAIALHVPILFNGIFPLFGVLLFGLQGILLIDFSIMCLLGLAWGALKLKSWAWWGSLIYFVLLTLSLILTLSRYGFSDILAGMVFPPTEMEALQGIPLHGLHIAALIGIPLPITVGLIIFSKRYFSTACQPT